MIVGNLKVYWRYPGNGVTECFIEDTERNRLASGKAGTYHTDKWNKWVGRKTAFERAVVNIPTKEVRGALWNALRKESPKTFKFGKL